MTRSRRRPARSTTAKLDGVPGCAWALDVRTIHAPLREMPLGAGPYATGGDHEPAISNALVSAPVVGSNDRITVRGPVCTDQYRDRSGSSVPGGSVATAVSVVASTIVMPVAVAT